jgi:predicted ester cyclase
MSVERNKESARRCFEEVWNNGNLAAIPEVIAQDYVGHSARPVKGQDGFAQTVQNMRAAFPDMRYTIESAVGEGDWLAIRLTLSGTNTGKMGNIEPTGKHVVWKQALFNRYVDGKCVEATSYGDSADMYKQLGVPNPNA